MTLFRTPFALLLATTIASSTHAEEQLTQHTLKATSESKAIDADFDQLKWLTGEWSGEGLGGQCLESWSPAAAGSMIGTFRLIEDDKLNLCEVFLLTKTDAGIHLKLKHFNDQLVGWEEKDKCVDFPLLKVGKNTAWFGGLTYQLQKDGSLKAWVAMKKKDGTFREAEIHLQPVTKQRAQQRAQQ